MRVLVTAGPTREYIDSVRFLSNASSGRMGLAVAAAAARRGHQVTLLAGQGSSAWPGRADVPDSLQTVPFTGVGDLLRELRGRFCACDALIMAAAVGDFRPERVHPGKLSRRGGPITLRLVPTEDVLATVAASKRGDQTVIAFAVEDGDDDEIEARAREEGAEKNADFVVLNTPAAMRAEESRACILARDRVVLPWGRRSKKKLAEEIVKLLR